MPMLGIMASAISGNLWAPAGVYESISSITLSASASSITFSGIPATYTHLQIRGFYNNSAANMLISIGTSGGADTGVRGHLLNGTGSAAQALSYTPLTNGIYIDYNGPTNTTSFYGSILDILDYSNTNKNKVFRTLFGVDTNGGGEVGINSGLFTTTNAITSVTLTSTTASRIAQYSSFALYGVK
jgi:hypothetical protein